MTFRDLLQSASRELESTDSPYLDALVLLCHASGVSKERLLASLPDEVPMVTEGFFRELLKRRLKGEPVSYIRNRKEFWDMEFYVDSRVLVPRPDTEVLVEEALRILRATPRFSRVHDSCTGSGCIAAALKSEIPGLEISVSDISPEALEVADFNFRSLLKMPLPAQVSDLLYAVEGPFDLITCNPPYVEHDYVEGMVSRGWPEPVLALDGGEDGFALIPRLLTESMDRLVENGYLIVEASPALVPRIADTMVKYGYRDVDIIKDLSGRPRDARGCR